MSLRTKTSIVLLTAVLAAVSGCGQNKSSSTSSTPSPSPTPAPAPTPSPSPSSSVTLSGTVAIGAALGSASVKAYDATDTEVASATTSSTGSYQLTIPATGKAPFVLVATHEDSDPLTSVVAEAKSGTANITPLTHVIAAQLSATGNPLRLASELKSGTASAPAATVQARADALMAAIDPVLTATGTSRSNPISTAFVANGDGMDRVLDALAVQVTPNGSSSQIEIAVRDRIANGAQPNAIRVANSQSLGTLGSVSALNLPGSGTKALLDDLATRLTACYAVPLAERVNASGTGPADILSSVCRTLFYNDDPATLLHDGFRVARNSGFGDLWDAAATGQKFAGATFSYVHANDDLAGKMRSTYPDGTSMTFEVHARMQNGKLKLIGNQSNDDIVIEPVAEQLNLINQPQFSYFWSGYSIRIGNLRNGDTSLYDRVVVTAPTGQQFTFRAANANATFLGQQKADGTIASGTHVRMAAGFVDTTQTGSPAEKDTNTTFAAPLLSDAQVSSIGSIGAWKFDVYLAGNTGASPNRTEYRRTATRSPSIAELRQMPWPEIQSSILDTWKTASAGGTLPITVAGPLPVAWTVPSFGWAPTQVSVNGRSPSIGGNAPAGFSDRIEFQPSERSTVVLCVSNGSGDNHCDGSSGSYAVGSRISTVALTAINHKFATLRRTYTFSSF